jgi:hypothetical protein
MKLNFNFKLQNYNNKTLLSGKIAMSKCPSNSIKTVNLTKKYCIFLMDRLLIGVKKI